MGPLSAGVSPSNTEGRIRERRRGFSSPDPGPRYRFPAAAEAHTAIAGAPHHLAILTLASSLSTDSS
jgi:hypothetical protein